MTGLRFQILDDTLKLIYTSNAFRTTTGENTFATGVNLTGYHDYTAYPQSTKVSPF